MISYKNCKILVVVPLRLESKRLPGKILKEIASKTLAQRAIGQILKAIKNKPQTKLAVAIDSLKTKILLEKAFPKKDFDIIYTNKSLRSGTDRVHAAYQSLLKNKAIRPKQLRGLINVQGDMPFLDPKVLNALIEKMLRPKSVQGKKMWTLAQKWPQKVDIKSLDHVKVVCSASERALYFSRFPIPCSRRGKSGNMLLHIGVYGYTTAALANFCKSKCPALERSEKLEQLRALYLDIPIFVQTVKASAKHNFKGVDTAADLRAAREFAKDKGL